MGDLGRADEAVPLFERALAIIEAALGPDHPRAKAIQQVLSEAVQQQRHTTPNTSVRHHTS
ncbi:tetratricopeptide repeat protein [Microbispora triticiradicis]|uniref:tetratricopeptide repeat protein n=1 Tax=Microbispora triticiradicis TaxID=2200763 RepID=UPI0034D4ECA2